MSSPGDSALGSAPSCKEAGLILFRLFLLSQGSFELQRNLFRYIALTYPAWWITQEERGAIVATALPSCTRYIARGWHIEVQQAAIEREVRRQSIRLARSLENEPEEREVLLADIFQGVIQGDFAHLQKEKGRPRPLRRDRRAQTLTGPFFSQFCQFGLLHRPTGAPVFDHLFAELVDAYHRGGPARLAALSRQSEHSLRYKLKTILTLHSQHYPHLPLSLPAPF